MGAVKLAATATATSAAWAWADHRPSTAELVTVAITAAERAS